MISVTSSQLEAWIAVFFWPFLRVLGFVLSEPVFGNRAVPLRMRAGLAFFLAWMVAPLVPAAASVPIDSPQALLVAAQQLLIGFVLGFAMRLVLAGIEAAGQIIGLSMGLGFAVFFDPQNSAQTPVMGQVMSVFALLVFFAINGHLLVIAGLVESFHILPIGDGLAGAGFAAVAQAAGQIFLVGVLLSLPVVVAILIANVAFGILTRAAPQLNIFAVGFPITILAGFLLLLLALPYVQPHVARLWETGALQALELLQGMRPAR